MNDKQIVTFRALVTLLNKKRQANFLVNSRKEAPRNSWEDFTNH